MTINDLIRESLSTFSIVSVSSASILSISIYSSFSVSIESRPVADDLIKLLLVDWATFFLTTFVDLK